MRKCNFTPQIKEDIALLFINYNNTIATLAKIYNVSEQTITRVLVDAGVYTPKERKSKEDMKNYHMSTLTCGRFDIVTTDERTLVIERTNTQPEPDFLFEGVGHYKKALDFVKDKNN